MTEAKTQRSSGSTNALSAANGLFEGPGEMRELCRAHDWASTPFGPAKRWPVSLRVTVATMLASRHPMFLWWGSELAQIFNDAYRPSFGADGRHLRALGARGKEFWTEIWPIIGPQIEQIMAGGAATWHEDQLVPIERNGRIENVWWTYGYSPAFDDDGQVNGVLVVCQETTRRVLDAQERERLLAATAAAEHSMSRLLSQISDAHIVMDKDFTILFINDTAERLMQWSRADLLGLNHWTAFPHSVGTPLEAQYRRVVAEHTEAHFVHSYSRDGWERHLEIDAYPTEEGGIALFWRDVSKRIAAESALTESEARLRAIYDGTYEYIGLLSPDGTVLEANRASFEFAQNTREDVVGKKFWETAWVTPTPGASDWIRDAVGRAAAGEFVRTETHLIRPSGEQKTFDISLHPVFDDAGNVVLIVPEGRDITERNLAEAALREAGEERERLMHALDIERQRLAVVFKQAPSFLAVLRGKDYVFELANDAYHQLIGRRDIIGKSLAEALPEIPDQGFIALLDAVVATGVPYIGRDVSIMIAHTPGAPPEERFIDFNYLPLIEADGSPVGVIAHGTDVTEQAQARREIERLYIMEQEARVAIEESYRTAESANRAKSEFLAVMSHELRTPLNAIGGYAELLEMGIRGPVTPEQRDDLHRIQTSQRHLLGLINEVLNYAKLETGSVHYQIEDVPVREVLNAAELLVAPQARAKKLTLVVGDCAPTLSVRADPEKLRQIIVNLLSNAVKFTDGGGRIEIVTTADVDTVRIVVHDTGIGIVAGKLDVIFDPFVQVRSDLTRPHEGTGLGLAISRDLAHGMEGNLTVESALGVGSVFTLTLPKSSR